MGDLSLRNVDDELMRRLREQAERNGRSLEAEHKTILRKALFSDASDPTGTETMSWEERAARLRKLTSKRQQTPSEVVIREDRDSR